MLTMTAISNLEAADFGALVIPCPSNRWVRMTASLRQFGHQEGSAIG
jgi:hypothetical protein